MTHTTDSGQTMKKSRPRLTVAIIVLLLIATGFEILPIVALQSVWTGDNILGILLIGTYTLICIGVLVVTTVLIMRIIHPKR
jgi:hypothetical protein